MEKLLKKSDFHKFLDDLASKNNVLGPTRKGGGTSTYANTMFAPIRKLEDLELDYKSSMLSPKKILFPDNQDLYAYKVKNDQVCLTDLTRAGENDLVLLGLHPCDLSAIRCLDKLFLKNRQVEDVYKARREKTTLIGLTCDEPHSTCFCNQMGSGPDAEEGYDLLMTDIGNGYFVKAGSDKGLLMFGADYFSQVTNEDRRSRKEALARLDKALPKKLNLEKIVDHMVEKFNDDLWKEFSDVCCSCGACNMVCPTCHCFTVIEKTSPDRDSGRRVLVWDTCHFERFAQMAADRSVRSEKSQRYKHRLYDKFYYDFNRHDNYFCVGCGRCEEFCPAHISMRSVLARLEE